jgi:hypothetical protein
MKTEMTIEEADEAIKSLTSMLIAARTERDRLKAEKAAIALHFAEAVLLLGRIRNVLPFETEICARINRFLQAGVEQPLQ